MKRIRDFFEYAFIVVLFCKGTDILLVRATPHNHKVVTGIMILTFIIKV